MSKRFLLLLFSLTFLVSTSSQWLIAEEAGQADLDKAVDAKLDANSLDDLAKVVELCESALKKGLAEGDTKFAKQLLTSVLYQRAEQFSRGIFEQNPPSSNWKKLRERALGEIDKALAINSKLGNMNFLKARLLFLPEGDPDEAKASLKKAIEQLEDDPLQLSKALLVGASLEKDPATQVAMIDRAIQQDPDNIDALKLRGVLSLQLEDYQKALDSLKTVVEKDPNDVAAIQAYAEAFAGLKKFDQATAQLDQLVKSNPNSPVAYMLRARISVLAEDYEAAMKDIDQVLVLAPGSISALMMRAQIYRETKRFADAEKDLNRILSLEPSNVQAIVMRALVLDAQGKFDQIIEELQKELEQGETQIQLVLANAQVLQASKEISKAIEVYSLIVEKYPDSWEALYGRSDAYLSVGKHKEAIEGYKKALKLKKDESNLLNNYAWVLATSPKDDLRDGVKAIDLAKQACKLTEYKAPHILSTLAAAYAESGDFENAKKWSLKAVELGEDQEVIEQLREELKNYEAQKPWREIQNEEEEKEETAAEEPSKEQSKANEESVSNSEI